MAYSSYNDLLYQVDEKTLLELADDEDTERDHREERVYYFQCDTENEAGHFEDSDNAAVSVGLGNTANRIVTGVKFRIGGSWYTIDTIIGDGSADNAIKFSETLATGTYEVELLMSANVSSRVTRAIADADAEIDSYLGAIYSLPITPVSDTVRKISVDIALYNLFSRRQETFSAETKHIRNERYQAAIESLKSLVASGTTGDSSVSQNDQTAPEHSNFDDHFMYNKTSNDYKARVFSRGKLQGF